jgi:hypothetical protein
LFEDPGPGAEALHDLQDCVYLLDLLIEYADPQKKPLVPDARPDTVMGRLKWLAQRWLQQAQSAGHSVSCQDKLCTSARKILNFQLIL